MKKHLLLFLCVLLTVTSAHAQVRVVKSSTKKISIDVSGMRGTDDATSKLFLQTLEKDLRLSGWFDIVRKDGEIRLNGTADSSGENIKSGCQVYRLNDQQTLLSKNYNGVTRAMAHRMADDIVEAVTGQKGFASMRIALIGNRSGKKEIYICDGDGGGLRQVTNEKKIVVGPNWSPDGNNIVYTSYLRGYPDVCRIDLNRSQRELVAGYNGLNTGGAISPNGKEMAVILSKEGNPELYIKNLRSGALTKLTATPRATEASPSWSPDGQNLVFVSDASGSPQLYITTRTGGAPKRISSRGSQNVAPDWGANGLIACSSLSGGRYSIAIIQPVGGQTILLTNDGADYEDPSWTPNGRHLIAARTVNHQSSLYLLDTVSDRPVALLQGGGSWYSPACTP